MGVQLPERYGGAAVGAVDYCICIEELARVDPAIALSVAAHNGLAAHIHMFGTDAQRDRHLATRIEAARWLTYRSLLSRSLAPRVAGL